MGVMREVIEWLDRKEEAGQLKSLAAFLLGYIEGGNDEEGVKRVMRSFDLGQEENSNAVH